VELLVASLLARKVSIPGVPEWPMRHPVTANGKNIITYLSKRYAHVPQLEKDTQLACSRFWEFGQALVACQQAVEAGTADEALLEDLKLKTYFVANFYDHFKEDPLLRQLFPPPAEPPKPRTGPIGSGSVPGMERGGTDSITRYRQQRETAVRKAEAHLRVLGPGIERIRRLLALGKQDRGAALLGMLNPMDMRERAVLKRIRDAKQFDKLETFIAAVDTIVAELPKVREGAPYERMDEQLNIIIGMHAAWGSQPGLNELLPPLS
jgi:hypothetical protein